MTGTHALPGDRPLLEIDLAAVRRNFRRVRDTLGRVTLGGVVKSDAYGLGAGEIARLLHAEGCRDFWVASFDEAVMLRPHLPDSRLFVLHGMGGAGAGEFRALGAIPVLAHGDEVAAAREEAARRGVLPVAVHLDTGLTRLGLDRDDVARIAAEPARVAGLDIRAYVTHLAHYAEPDAPMNARQQRRLREWAGRLPPAPLSLAASSCVFGPAPWHLDHARVGSALFGIDTTPARPQPIEPCLTLSAPILRVALVPAGSEVGYGGQYRTPSPRRLASVALGYGNGVPTGLANRGAMRIGGHSAPIVGGIAMGMLSLDVTDLPEDVAVPGARVVLFDAVQRPEAVAALAGLPPNALLTALGACCERRYLNRSERRGDIAPADGAAVAAQAT